MLLVKLRMNRDQFQVMSAEVIPVSNIVYDKSGNIDLNATLSNYLALSNNSCIEIGKKRKRVVIDGSIDIRDNRDNNKRTRYN